MWRRPCSSWCQICSSPKRYVPIAFSEKCRESLEANRFDREAEGLPLGSRKFPVALAELREQWAAEPNREIVIDVLAQPRLVSRRRRGRRTPGWVRRRCLDSQRKPAAGQDEVWRVVIGIDRVAHGTEVGEQVQLPDALVEAGRLELLDEVPVFVDEIGSGATDHLARGGMTARALDRNE